MNFQEFKNKYEKKEVEVVSNNVKTPIKLSVCVVTYNHINFIEKCLDSILEQQVNFNYEILIGDDYSTDGTRDTCLKYARKYPDRIRCFLHHRDNNIRINGRITGRFNFLYNLYQANGKYIALLDGDDYWVDSLKLQKQIDFLEKNPDFILTYHDAMVVNDRDHKTLDSQLPISSKRDASKEDLICSKIWIKTLTICFRNRMVTFPELLFEAPNGDTVLISLLGHHGKGKWLGEQIKPSAYRKHEGGVWSLQDENRRFQMNIITLFQLMTYYLKINERSYSWHYYDMILFRLNKFALENNIIDAMSQNRVKQLKSELNKIQNSRVYKFSSKISRLVDRFSKF